VGDTVEVLALGGAQMTVSGIATFGDADSRFGTVTALFDEATAQRSSVSRVDTTAWSSASPRVHPPDGGRTHRARRRRRR
jgi:hypothetical protein